MLLDELEVRPHLGEALAAEIGYMRLEFTTHRIEHPVLTVVAPQAIQEPTPGRLDERLVIDSKVVRLVARESELPAHLTQHFGPRSGVAGVFDPKTKAVYLVAENLTERTVKGVLLHELGVHYGLREMLGQERFRGVVAEMRRLKGAGHTEVTAAYGTVPNDTPRAFVDEEAIAYLIERHPELPLVKRIIAAIRAFLYRHGLLKNLTPDDIKALAIASARRAARQAGGGLPQSTLALWSKALGVSTEELRREYYETAARVREDAWMLAPNGANTRLSERQWVLVRTPRFKEWFGDWEADPGNASKVLDENGEPLVVTHHGYITGGVFKDVTQDVGPIRRKVLEWGLIGHWFADPKAGVTHEGYGPNRVDAFLNIRNPLDASWDADRRGDLVPRDQFLAVVAAMDGYLSVEIARMARRLRLRVPKSNRVSTERAAQIYDRFTAVATSKPEEHELRWAKHQALNWRDFIYHYTDMNTAESIPGNDTRDSIAAGQGKGNIDIRTRLTKALRSFGYDGYFSHDGASVAFESEQIKSIDNSGAFGAGPDIRFSGPAPIFYSEMLKFVTDRGPGKAKAAEWAKLLDTWGRQGKFKGEEMEWSGVKEWLDLQPKDWEKLETATLTKDQVQAFLRANGVQVEETALGRGGLTREEQEEFNRLDWGSHALSTAEGKRWDALKRKKDGLPTKHAQWQLPGGSATASCCCGFQHRQRAMQRT